MKQHHGLEWLMLAGIACIVLGMSCDKVDAGDVRPAAPWLAQPVSGMAPADRGLPIPPDGFLTLVLDHDGLLSPVAPETVDPAPAPYAVKPALAALHSMSGDAAALAVNRSGMLHLSVRSVPNTGNQQADSSHDTFRLDIQSVPGHNAEFNGRSIAQAWGHNGTVLVLLHRNDIMESLPARKPVSAIIVMDGTETRTVSMSRLSSGIIGTFNRNSALYESPYALFPLAPDRWLVQFRLEDGDRVHSAFAAWTPDSDHMELLDRQRYERDVSPRSLSLAKRSLNSAMLALGTNVAVEVAMIDGTLQHWSSGSHDTAMPAWACELPDGYLAVAWNGRLAIALSDRTMAAQLPQPLDGASFRDAAVFGNVAAVIWEEHRFPELGRTGLIVFRLDSIPEY